MKKPLGSDRMPNWIPRERREQLVDKILIRGSLNESKVPSNWKCVNIVLIYKQISKEEPKNYRSVSLTRVEAKL